MQESKKDVFAENDTIRLELNAVLIENSELKKRVEILTSEMNSNISAMEFLEHEKARLDRERLQLVKALRLRDSEQARLGSSGAFQATSYLSRRTGQTTDTVAAALSFSDLKIADL